MKSRKKLLSLASGWATYLRTSDEDAQAPERSQASQRRLIRERLVESSGLPLITEYADIFSGRATDRKDYQRLLADARLGRFSHVAVAFVDRFGRNDVEGLRAFDELIKLGIAVRIATYPSLDASTPDGRMIVGMLFNVARFESERLGQRTREGMKTKLLDGEWTWKAPEGYINREVKLTDSPLDEKLKHARYKRWVEADPQHWQCWRDAWDLLLQDKPSLADICTELYRKGYTSRGGRPFVRTLADGRQLPNVNMLSSAFHNWFYAGWVVVDNDWAQIPPKVVRGRWQPVVTTEEFELGLSILAGRNENRPHQKIHYYLLQGLIFLQTGPEKVTKLTCSKPNANRTGGGVPYYCIGSSDVNFLCSDIDKQIPSQLRDLQLPGRSVHRVRDTFVAQIEHYLGKANPQERAALEATLRQINQEELDTARLRARRQISDSVWEVLWNEWQAQRSAIQTTLQGIGRQCEAYIAALDDALNLLAKSAILFNKLDLNSRRDLLRHLVRRVVANREGQILRLELRAPFGYLNAIATGDSQWALQPQVKVAPQKAKKRTSTQAYTGSTQLRTGAPTGLRPHSLPHPFTSRPPRPYSALRRHSSASYPSAQ